jgi:hypothetical protein
VGEACTDERILPRMNDFIPFKGRDRSKPDEAGKTGEEVR